MKTFCYSMLVFLFSTTAIAGTAGMDFDYGVGLLTAQQGAGSLIASGGRGVFTGQNVSLLAEDGDVVFSGGTTVISTGLRPSTDAVNLVGLVMFSSEGDMLRATCSSDGLVTLTDYIGIWRSTSFNYPAALNAFSLTYSASTGRATLSLNNGESSVFIEDALAGAMSVSVGVACGGTGAIESFAATGTGIPNYPPVSIDSDGDGVSDADENEAGTNINDAGNRPVNGAVGATVTDATGVSVSFPAGSFSGFLNIDIYTPDLIPTGATPGDAMLSGAGASLEPSATFISPVTVSIPYTNAQIEYIDEATLTPLYFDGSSYSATGIGGVSVNASTNVVTFTSTHFTVFALAGDPADTDGDGVPDIDDVFPSNPNGQTDTDSDGLGDEWEIDWFGNLTTADETTDYDSDGVSDLREFEAWYFNFDPTDGTTELPAAGIAGLAAAALALATLARRRLDAKRQQ